jgi:hypothetical protein
VGGAGSVLLAIVFAGAADKGASSANGAAPSDPPIAIAWNVPAGCPDVEALEAEVRRIAGQGPPPVERLEATATIRRGPEASWQLTLRTQAGSRAGERVLTARDCGELMHAAALVMALMINPQASAVAAAPPPPPPPPPPAEVERRFAAGAELVMGSGALPGIAPGIAIRFAAARAALSGELRASVLMPQRVASPADAAAGGTFDLLEAALAGCARARRTQRLSPGACVGATVVRVHGAGYGVTDPGAGTAWWPALMAEGSLRVGLSARNAVRLAAQALFSPGRPNFALAGVGQVFEPAPIWLRGTLGWELHF